MSSGYRREEIVLTRLRLGHSALNKTLKLIGKHQTGLCEGCQEEEESVEHVVLRCRRYEVQREEMMNKMKDLGIQEFTLKGLLSMGERAQVRALIEFLKGTGVYDRI